jgi:hypothetical protein
MAAIGAGAIGAGAIRAVIDEAALNQLVRGQSATLVAQPGEQPVELILSDIGWPRIFAAVRSAYMESLRAAEQRAEGT